ncbi:MAG TPA: class I SAM-dependent methyltransferase [Thermoanaerobaculia bacterium]|jgi:ubiquinone/menaquinone biosynthesis C-methylase UbiE|nr:class I SAM-dependent methyltransferase [Thermoanaerobaculia bacterium]
MPFARQLARPRGLLGLLAGEALAWQNREVNAWTLSLLGLGVEDRIVEIGFGPGVGVRLAAARARRGLVAGVDPSSMMVRRARWRNQRAVRRGRVDLRRGTVEELPWVDATFTHAWSVNTFFEWPDQAAGLAEVARVLRPGGRLALTTQARWAHDEAEAKDATREALDLLAAAGFHELEVKRRRMKPLPAVCLLGSKLAVSAG